MKATIATRDLINLLNPASVAVSKSSFWASAKLQIEPQRATIIAQDNYLFFTMPCPAQSDERGFLGFGRSANESRNDIETMLAVRDYVATLNPECDCTLSTENGKDGLLLKIAQGRTMARFPVFVVDPEDTEENKDVFARLSVKDLLRAIDLVSPAIAPNDNVPSLYGLCVRGDTELMFAASDGYWGAIADLKNADLVSPINVVINAEALHRVVRVLGKLKPKDTEIVNLSLINGFAVFSVGDIAIRAALQGLEYPNIQSVFGEFPEKMAKIAVSDLVYAARLARPFKFDGTRPLRFEFEADKLCISMRGSEGDFEFHADYHEPPEGPARCQLSHAIFSKAIGALSDSKMQYADVRIAPQGGAMQLRAENVRYMIMPMR